MRWWRERRRPIAAALAVRRLFKDPQDTDQTFQIIRACGGGDMRRLYNKRPVSGFEQQLRTKPLRPTLMDHDYLLSFPSGTLARAYMKFITNGAYSADELAEVSETNTDLWYDSGRDEDADLLAFSERLRDAHDLWHVVCRYDRDILGELAILAFTYEQTGLRGAHYIPQIAMRNARRHKNTEFQAFIAGGYLRGRDAVDMTLVPWEKMLGWRLSRVQAQLHIVPCQPYEKFTDIKRVPTRIYL